MGSKVKVTTTEMVNYVLNYPFIKVLNTYFPNWSTKYVDVHAFEIHSLYSGVSLGPIGLFLHGVIAGLSLKCKILDSRKRLPHPTFLLKLYMEPYIHGFSLDVTLNWPYIFLKSGTIKMEAVCTLMDVCVYVL